MTEAKASKRALELGVDAELYPSEQSAKALKVLADAKAYSTVAVTRATIEHGI